MRRREFLAASLALCLPASLTNAQPVSRVRKVGIVVPYPATDTEVQGRLTAFREELRSLGWRADENVEFDERWTTDNMDRVRAAAADVISHAPDVILITSGRVTSVMYQQTKTIPVVFTATTDPVGRGFVRSLARPGGNMTGFALSELPLVEEQLDLLREIAPNVRRVAFVFNPDNPATALSTGLFEAAAIKIGIEPVVAPVHNQSEIERFIETHSREANAGALFPSDVTTLTHRDAVVAAAGRHRLPAVYAARAMATSGGLLSYSPDHIDLFRRSAGYVDRILRGESPADLPVQQPTKFELVINLKAAQLLDLEVPPTLLARADEVIE